jgi:PAS domain S-box-containing protein
MKDGIVQRVVAVFVLMLVILTFVAFVAVRNVRRSVAGSDWVNHTHDVMHQVDGILSSMISGDAALRSFLITTDARDQTAYREAYNEMKEHLDVALALTRNESADNKKILNIKPLLEKRINFTRDLVKARQQDGIEGARKYLVSDSGGESLHAIEKAVAKFQEEEKSVLRERDKASYAQAQTTKWTVLSGISMNFVLLGFTAFLVRDDIRARNIARTALEAVNLQLEAKVQERTAELAAANEILRAENLERQWGNKSLEHQLRYSNLIINSINDLVFVLTKTLNITRVNPAVSHHTGLETKDLITSPLMRVVRSAHDAGATAALPELLQALREGREVQGLAVVLVSKEGRSIPYRLSLFPLRDRDKVVGGVVTLRVESVMVPNPVAN